ncbi:MAG: hypothetical protein AB1716_12815 [Planctomycetota bacterium]
MSKHASFVVIFSLLISGATQAGYIHQQNQFYNEPFEYWYTIYSNGYVVIHHAVQGQVFQFDVTHDGHDADINLITADENAGPVTIEILPFHGQNHGADNVKEIRLAVPGVTSVIQALSVAYNVGDLGPVAATRIENDFKCEFGHIMNDITVGSLWGTLDAHTMRNITITNQTSPPPGQPGARIYMRGDYSHRLDVLADDLEYLQIDGSVFSGASFHVGGDAWYVEFGQSTVYDGVGFEVDHDLHEFVCYGVWNGDLTVGHDWLLGHYIADPSFEGTITVENDYWANVTSQTTWYTPIVVGDPELGVGDWRGSLTTPLNWPIFAPITIHGHVAYSGSITSGADLWQDYPISVGGDMDGLIDVTGSIPCDITIGSSMTGRIVTSLDLTGNIVIGGDMASDTAGIWIGRNLSSSGLAHGHIIVNGMFGGAPNCTVQIAGIMENPTAFISFNYDAPPPLDSWPAYPPSAVRVGANLYYETEPSLHIWGISKCRGDMDNSHAVDFNDINPFVQALSYPGDYALAYPGLAGSMVWHGDCTCDGAFNFADINPFVARIGKPCDPNCAGADGPPSAPPEQTAEALRTHVRPENRVPLLSIVAQTAMQARSRAVRDYWQAVYEHLTR